MSDTLNAIRQTRWDRIRERIGADILRIHPEVFSRAAEEATSGEFYIDPHGDIWLCGMAVEKTADVLAFEIR